MMGKLLKSRAVIVIIFLLGAICMYLNWYDSTNTFQNDSENLAVGSMVYGVQEGHVSEYGLLLAEEKDVEGFILDIINSYWGLDEVEYTNYSSQIGLQGYAYQILAIVMCSGRGIMSLIRLREILCGVCCALMAAVSMGIVIALGKKYNYKLSLAFFITFILSPWVKDFSVNLYWVEFTWFIPMLLGIVMSLDYEEFDKLWFYAFVFFAVAVKSACGYEYITTVMLGLILVPLVDLFTAERYERKSILIIIFKLGVVALVGFFTAIFIHSLMRGDGNVIVGIESIYQNDVLRRTLGGDPELFPDVYRNSIEAGVWDTVSIYWEFYTDVITGVSANLFVPLTVFSLIVFLLRVSNKNNHWEIVFSILSCVGTLSWYVLGKSHSYIHTGMNYVLWYFGFVQMLIYSLFCAFSDCLLNNLGKNNIIKCLNVK